METERKVWLITGTSTGIGRELVREALRRGDRVLASLRSIPPASDFSPRSHFAAEGLTFAEEDIHCFALDLDWDTPRITAAATAAIDAFCAPATGRVDYLVNNAGYVYKGLSEEGGSEAFREQFQTVLFGAVDVTNAVLPYMRTQRQGRIVLIGSRTGWFPEFVGAGVYGASKAALRVYGETLSSELAPFNIQTLIVEPASVRTEGATTKTAIDESNPIPDYDSIRAVVKQRILGFKDTLRGDAKSAARVIVEVATMQKEEGGKKWPVYLPLGEAAVKAIEKKTGMILQAAEEWKEVVSEL